ncbi:alpha/beta hydrolase [Caulobacter sp. 17J65-9]|uniref:alpha/beta fold hydrolase n=1 Tax=Caulobacter sp. 17J65-9 TaxID=2709382 RepID=UPI0013CD940F|nr:alpha/beta hydrolase [Caulobacter sp. 17J65-9]NEX94608.1 alpha/beta hydrolase [Caulobacter sp. 17J65-9]
MKVLGILLKATLVIVALVTVAVLAVWLSLRKPDIPYAELEKKYATAASHYVELPSGVRVHFRDEGKPDAPVIVLVHGFSASAHTWEPWVKQLGGDYRVISLDLPGHGLTRAPANWKPSMEAYAAMLEEFAAAEQLSKFTLVGQSMGGNVAWEYALARPERLDALVLVSASGWPVTRREGGDGDKVMKLMARPWGRAALRDLDASRLMREGLEKAYQNGDLITEATVDRYVELNRAPGHRDIVLDLALGFDKRNFATPERLAAIKTPTLILHGQNDRLVPVDDAQKFAQAIPGSKLVIYANTGHMLNEERAAESSADLKAFLAALKPAAPKKRVVLKAAPPAKIKELKESPLFFQ